MWCHEPVIPEFPQQDGRQESPQQLMASYPGAHSGEAETTLNKVEGEANIYDCPLTSS